MHDCKSGGTEDDLTGRWSVAIGLADFSTSIAARPPELGLEQSGRRADRALAQEAGSPAAYGESVPPAGSISTLRFSARPFSVALSAMGRE